MDHTSLTSRLYKSKGREISFSAAGVKRVGTVANCLIEVLPNLGDEILFDPYFTDKLSFLQDIDRVNEDIRGFRLE